MVVPLRPALPGGAPNVCAVLGNLGDSAGLLRFREVETLLHELGHVFHALAGSPKPSILGWAWPMVPWPGGVEMDFLEVPSMLTQQFVYAPEMLAKIARPHSETGAPLPRETIDALAANRHLLAGAGTARSRAGVEISLSRRSPFRPILAALDGGRRPLYGLGNASANTLLRRYLAMCRYDLAMHELSEDDATRLDMPTLWPPICLDVAGVEEPEDTHFASTWSRPRRPLLLVRWRRRRRDADRPRTGVAAMTWTVRRRTASGAGTTWPSATTRATTATSGARSARSTRPRARADVRRRRRGPGPSPYWGVAAAACDRLSPSGAARASRPDTRSTRHGGAAVRERSSEANAGITRRYAKFADRLDAKEGARLRDIILEPGAAASGQAMIKAFLGRPVSDDAYFSRLGV